MKITGSVLIIIASVAVAFYYENKQKNNLIMLTSVYNFLEFIKNQIEFFSLPLNLIYEKYQPKNDCILSLIGGEVPKIFSQNIQDKLADCFLQLGKGYKTEQIDKLNYTISQIEKEINTMQRENTKKIKIFRAISLFIGCSIVILLV